MIANINSPYSYYKYVLIRK
uniref:Uncharacterized protein n=1 Tax=Musa acuminata subsp. malaccensis TaxID=214687 RepID=A0A804KXY8_MUSAM